MRAIFGLFLWGLLAFPLLGAEVPFYIGTYTVPGGSEGIYRATLNLETGDISTPVLAAKASNPNFLALDAGGRFVYAVNGPPGQVSAYAIEENGSLSLLNTVSSQGDGPCHLSLDQQGKFLFVANYTGGNLASFPIEANGGLGEPVTVFANSGSGPDPKRQEKPHLHAIYADPSNQNVYACDLGTDEVLTFQLNAGNGELTLAEPRAGKVPPGGGPRHLAIDSNGAFAYANNEMTSSVTVFQRDGETGQLTPSQTVSSLPDGADGSNNSTAEIFLHPNGKWLYVSNRGHDSIAGYQIGSDGKLETIGVFAAEVAVPRGFGIDPTGNWLIVGGNASDQIVAHRVDQQTGALNAGKDPVNVGKPVCIEFVKTAVEK